MGATTCRAPPRVRLQNSKPCSLGILYTLRAEEEQALISAIVCHHTPGGYEAQLKELTALLNYCCRRSQAHGANRRGIHRPRVEMPSLHLSGSDPDMPLNLSGPPPSSATGSNASLVQRVWRMNRSVRPGQLGPPGCARPDVASDLGLGEQRARLPRRLLSWSGPEPPALPLPNPWAGWGPRPPPDNVHGA